MKDKRRLLVFSSLWKSEAVSSAIEGIYKRFQDENFDIYIFNAYDIKGNENWKEQEQKIFFLPDIKDFDAAILILNTLDIVTPFIHHILDECAIHNIPTYSIDKQYEQIGYACIDNYASVYSMVKHLIEEHHCKVFNYLGGPEEHPENALRYRAFVQCLNDYNIPLDFKRVSHRRFLHSDGRRAYNEWKESGLHLPDAIVCANDEMALGYTVAAREEGYITPRDYLITGFDNIEEGQKNIPSISSISRSWDVIGYECANSLLDYLNQHSSIQNISVPGKCILNASCGCHGGDDTIKEAYFQLYRNKKQEEQLDDQVREFRQALCECSSEDELIHNFYEFVKSKNLVDMAICINEFEQGEVKWDNEYYSPQIRCIVDGKVNIINKKNLIPDHWTSMFKNETQRYIFGSIYCGKNASGYTVMVYKPEILIDRWHKSVLDAIGIAVDSILRQAELNAANLQLSKLYVKDSLTGLYNRYGYAQEGMKFFEKYDKRVCIYFVDVDRLKYINDTFGHAMGDITISGTAKALQHVFSKDQILVRMGGDEFLVIESMEEKSTLQQKQKEIVEFMEYYCHGNKLPFDIQVSMGMIINQNGQYSLEELVIQADEQMYQIKQEKKKARD